jgi:hypothetical protein
MSLFVSTLFHRKICILIFPTSQTLFRVRHFCRECFLLRDTKISTQRRKESFSRLASSRLGVFALNATEKLLNFVVAAGRQKQKRLGAVLKNQPDVQADADFKKVSRQPANAQPSMSVRMPEILLQLLQCRSDFSARRFRISSDTAADALAQFQRFQSARSFSRLPEKRFTFPRFRSVEIFRSIRFSNRSNSAGVTPYSRPA